MSAKYAAGWTQSADGLRGVVSSPRSRSLFVSQLLSSRTVPPGGGFVAVCAHFATQRRRRRGFVERQRMPLATNAIRAARCLRWTISTG